VVRCCFFPFLSYFFYRVRPAWLLSQEPHFFQLLFNILQLVPVPAVSRSQSRAGSPTSTPSKPDLPSLSFGSLARSSLSRDADIIARVWKLLSSLPVNQQLAERMVTLGQSGQSEQLAITVLPSEAWDHLINPNDVFSLLYSLGIVETLIKTPPVLPEFIVKRAKPSVASADSSQNVTPSWAQLFVRCGGLTQLYNIIVQFEQPDHLSEQLRAQRKAGKQALALLLRIFLSFSWKTFYAMSPLSFRLSPELKLTHCVAIDVPVREVMRVFKPRPDSGSSQLMFGALATKLLRVLRFVASDSTPSESSGPGSSTQREKNPEFEINGEIATSCFVLLCAILFTERQSAQEKEESAHPEEEDELVTKSYVSASSVYCLKTIWVS
jgi:hypothetical protein